MSMIGCFIAVSDADLQAIIEKPSRIDALLGMEAPVESPSFVARLFGSKAKPQVPEAPWRPQQEPREFDVDKAWQGIHFLLTGSDWEGTGPLAFILHGGTEIPQELGYGPPHGFTAAEVKTIAEALQPITSEALFERGSVEEFRKNSIYPEIWAESKIDSIGYVTTNFADLKKFVQETADANAALIVYIG
jgi:hypothetical protein